MVVIVGRDLGPFKSAEITPRMRGVERPSPSSLVTQQTGSHTLEFADDSSHGSVNAARLSITDGCMGTQSVSEIGSSPGADGAIRVAGLYGPEPPGLLLSGPAWTPVGWSGEGLAWSLDLDTGLVSHRLRLDGGELQTQRWAIADHPGCQAYLTPVDGQSAVGLTTPPASMLRGGDGVVSATAIADRRVDDRLLRVACTRTGRTRTNALAEAAKTARQLVERDPVTLVEDQHRLWQRRWSCCELCIDGDSTAELRTRFALFHLLALSDHGEELAVGARGLSGNAYGGHVFWDADTFVLPSLASLAPGAARAMIEYRLRRLEAARQFAGASGHEGARFPWESAASGNDVTPRWATHPAGDPVAIRTGQQEIHIGSDIALAIANYQRWSGDDEVMASGGAEVSVEIARYWASRISVDGRGRGHLNGVIGPDEYHEDVNDNAFTNRMAAWTLRRACQLAAAGYPAHHSAPADEAERRNWSQLASSIDLGFDPDRGRHLQFLGFDRLDPILAASIADRPFAADLLLGRDVVQRSQLIKQADVLMMHHLIPDEMPQGSLDRDVAYYLPRTAHGSSLSPAIHAAVLARAGRADEALRWYHLALGLDIDDLTQTGSGGLHYANLGGIWQALLGGFLGIRPTTDGLIIDPRLPTSWEGVRIGFQYRGSKVQVEAEPTRVEVSADVPLALLSPNGTSFGTATKLQLVSTGDGWAAS